MAKTITIESNGHEPYCQCPPCLAERTDKMMAMSAKNSTMQKKWTGCEVKWKREYLGSWESEKSRLDTRGNCSDCSEASSGWCDEHMYGDTGKSANIKSALPINTKPSWRDSSSTCQSCYSSPYKMCTKHRLEMELGQHPSSGYYYGQSTVDAIMQQQKKKEALKKAYSPDDISNYGYGPVTTSEGAYGKDSNVFDHVKKLEAKIADLRASIIELKEYAQEQVTEIDKKVTYMSLKPKLTSMGALLLETVAKQGVMAEEMLEHCLAALEENDE
jgi:hypothetical protein